MTDHFVTEAGVRVPAITTDQMREVDRIATSETGPNLFQMMENAGRSLAEVAMWSLDSTSIHGPVVVLAGTGGNGGGGICAARHLANRGLDVIVVLTDQARMGEVPLAQLDVYRSTTGDLSDIAGLDDAVPSLIIDALIGYSIEGPPRGRALELIEWSLLKKAPVLSLDVPSGIDATSGRAAGASVKATRTLTLALPKTGLGLITGDLLLADLGIPLGVYARLGISVPTELFSSSFVVAIRPSP